jgi:hypothetical protein
MTGRAAGYCAGFPVPGFMNPYVGWFGFGRGRGRGFGRGRGWRWALSAPWWAWRGWFPGWFSAPMPYGPMITPQQESEILKDQAEMLQEEIKAINERIKELEKEAKEKK